MSKRKQQAGQDEGEDSDMVCICLQMTVANLKTAQ